MDNMLKPKNRGAARQKLGILFFRIKRHMLWIFGGIKFARIGGTLLGHENFCHQTPLLRHLRGIDISLEENKITNLHIAVSKINGVTLEPGQTFSFWKLIGKPTRHKGYVEGVILRRGKFESGIGGGLCHLSGFIYWMTLHTPLTVAERHRHGYDTTPDKLFGSDATCFYNYKDLMIKNNTLRPFQLQMEVGGDVLKGSWRSDEPPDCFYEIYEKESSVKSESWGGHSRHNRLYRKIYNLDGIMVGDEFVAENHAIMMYEPSSDEAENGD